MDEEKRRHCVMIEDRERIIVSAVEDIESFDDEKVVVLCDMGEMTISGQNFKINKLNVDDGELIIEGIIDELQYSERKEQISEGGFLGRLFR